FYGSRDLILQQTGGLTAAEKQLVQDRLTYLGDVFSVRDMAKLYQAADAYVSPYFAEGFNLPALEAAACGTLVICMQGGPTDSFTRPEFALPMRSAQEAVQLTPRTSGVCLVPNEEYLLQQMTAAVARPELAARAREAGPPFVVQEFTWKQAAQKLVR